MSFPKPYILYHDHKQRPVFCYGKTSDGLFLCNIWPDSEEPSGHVHVSRISGRLDQQEELGQKLSSEIDTICSDTLDSNGMSTSGNGNIIKQ